MKLGENLPWTVMEPIPGLIDHGILITNEEGEDDDEEWHLPDFGRDEEYAAAYEIYRYFSQHGMLPYSGGWAEQLAVHKEIIDLFEALDVSIEGPKNGD